MSLQMPWMSGCYSFRKERSSAPAGFIDTPNQRLGIRSVLPIVTPEDLAQVPINDRKKPDGTPLRLGDVGDVVWDTWPLFGDAVINDGPGLMMIVEKLPWANTLDVTRGVEEAIDEMRPGLPGIEIDTTIFRPATFIETVDRQPHRIAADRRRSGGHRAAASSCTNGGLR